MSNRIKPYTRTEKVKIAERLGTVKSKKHRMAIFTIASKDKYIRDSGGVYLKISEMSDNTIEQIENFLNEHLPLPVVKTIVTPTPYYSDSANESSVKLTNMERNVLRNIDSATADSLVASVDSTNVTTSEQIIVKPLG